MTGPATLEEIAARVSAAVGARRPLRITGRGSWLAAGGPVDAAETLSVASYSGIADYVPGDLTITVRAGTPLSEIAAATMENGQWLPLDPPGSLDGSIGATVATGSYGPLATAFGRPRDQVLGLEFVSGTGEVITVGSRVVKNVAGFDLTRLLVGSWGTLGVITQVTLRLRARSDVERSAAVIVPGRGEKLAAALSAARAARLAPLALELLSPAVAEKAGLPRETLLLARLGGNGESVSAQLAELGSLGQVVAAPDDCWDRLRAMDGGAGGSLRFATPLSDLPLLWDTLDEAERNGTLTRHATVTRGIVRCLVTAPAGSDPASLSSLSRIVLPTRTARLIPERLGRDAWKQLVPPSAGDALSVQVKQAFDPENVLNPGILGAAQ
jgi:glycolate oxidase FAD binding subunit